ncbi:MAG: MAPEG family protein [Cyanobacteria bacterium P01_A01_bin.135]
MPPTSTVLLYCVVVAALLVYFPFLVVAYGRVNTSTKMDSPMQMFATPRALSDKLPQFAQRATWAHQNCFEAFILFSAAALMAYVTGVDSQIAAIAAIAHVAARALYSVAYILNVAPLRSLMFGIGSLSTFTLFILSLRTLA